jgi:hypothetical protein
MLCMNLSNLTIGHLTGLKAVIDNLRMPGINGMELINMIIILFKIIIFQTFLFR